MIKQPDTTPAADGMVINPDRYWYGHYQKAREEAAKLEAEIAESKKRLFDMLSKTERTKEDRNRLNFKLDSAATIARQEIAEQRVLIDQLSRILTDRDDQNKRQAQTIYESDRTIAELEAEVDRLTNRLREMCNKESSNLPRPTLELTGKHYASVEEMLKAEGVSDEVMALYLKYKAQDTESKTVTAQDWEEKKHPSTVIPGPIEDYRPWTMDEVLAGTILRWHDGGTAIVTAVRDGGLRVGDADYTFAGILQSNWRQLNGDRCGIRIRKEIA